MDESELQKLVSDLEVSPDIVNKESHQLYEFRKLGFTVYLNLVVPKCFCIFFALDTVGIRNGQFEPYRGDLIHGIVSTDLRSEVRQKMGAKLFWSNMKRGTVDKSVWYWKDWYFRDNLRFIFTFNADTNQLSGLDVSDTTLCPRERPSQSIMNFAPPRDVSNPKALLVQVEQTYSLCTSYCDTGSVDTYFDRGTPGERHSRLLFRTFFRRPDRFLFEWIKVEEAEPSGAHAVWCHNGHIFTTFLGKQEERASLNDALKSVAGVSVGASCLIPALLLPDLVPPAHSRLTELDMQQSDIEKFMKDVDANPEGALFFRGSLKPDYAFGINVDRNDLTINSVYEVSSISAGKGARMTRGVIKMLESSPNESEDRDVIAALEKQLNIDHEELNITVVYQYDSIDLNGEIAEGNFSWTPRTYSELEWRRREILT